MSISDPLIPATANGESLVQRLNAFAKAMRKLFRGTEEPGTGASGTDEPEDGQVWADEDAGEFKVYDATRGQWVSLWRIAPDGHPGPVSLLERTLDGADLTLDVDVDDDRALQVLFVASNGGNRTVTLPDATVRLGSRLLVVRRHSDNPTQTVTLQGASGAPFYAVPLGGGFGAITLDPGDVVECYALNHPSGIGWLPVRIHRAGVVRVTAAYTAHKVDRTIIADATSAAFAVTLPTAATSAGARIAVHRANAGANAVTIDVSGGGNINGSASLSLAAQYDKAEVVSDGVQWWA